MRTVSLLPAATEIVAAIGRLDDLVGVSHECDFPAGARTKPRVTACEIYGNGLPSGEIDRWVSEKLAAGDDLFTLDDVLLRELRPELILTQRLCDVCAPAYGGVVQLAATLPGPPRVLNLEPSSLGDILDNVRMVAEALGASADGAEVIARLTARIEFVRQMAARARHRPKTAVVEWLDPVFCSGHWTPELVEIAGGVEVLGVPHADSVRKTWGELLQLDPEILVIACCGQPGSRALEDWHRLCLVEAIQSLRAVRESRVYVCDGNAYFSRPGPRVVDTLEILAEIMHPELFFGRFPERGVVHLPTG